MNFITLFSLLLLVSCSKFDRDQNEPSTEDLAIQSEDSGILLPPVLAQNQQKSDPKELPTSPDPDLSEKASNLQKLDATSTTATAYFKLENNKLISSTNQEVWLFAAKRTQFQTNSGTSGTGKVGIHNTGSTKYDAIMNCEVTTFTYDEMLPASGAPGSQPFSGNALLNAWYDYNPATHVVSSKNLVYLINDGMRCFKFQIKSYSAGAYEVMADVLDMPKASNTVPVDPSKTIDASSTTSSVYLKFDQGQIVSTAADADWQFAVKRSQFQTNSGTSGSLNFGVAIAELTDYSQVMNCKAASFAADEMLPASSAPGSQPYSGSAILNAWYNYDPATHVLSSKNQIYLISNGNHCFKMQILSYAAGVYKVLVNSVDIQPPPAIYEQSIDASSPVNTVYLMLEQGQLVSTSIDQPWLLAVKRTQFQTNSGTSGTRGVGAYDSTSTDFSALTSCSELTYTYDAMLPASGAPGSQPYSGNTVLNAWYDYDFTTHIVSSKQLVYAISDGSECLKLQITNYASGVYTMKISQL